MIARSEPPAGLLAPVMKLWSMRRMWPVYARILREASSTPEQRGSGRDLSSPDAGQRRRPPTLPAQPT
jgi:hypothetical protein